MRLAVLQLEVRPGERTATLQGALRAIDAAAAETDPAPDLILLPAFRDVLAVTGGDASMTERCPGPVVAACGSRAREWGLFIALGFAEREADKPFVTTCLIDPDGDIRLSHRQSVFSTGPADRFSVGADFETTELIYGRVAVWSGDDCLDADVWRRTADTGAVLAIGSACWSHAGGEAAPGADEIRRRISGYAAGTGLCAAVADVTTGVTAATRVCPGYSVIVGSDGAIMASAEPGGAGALWADVELPEPASSAETEETPS
ncbi:MAG: nitrilase-related carbon-nitrogen hydrolase [Phycisphaerae bacterium]